MAFAAAILDSGVRIGNRCKLFPGFGPGRAVILDFSGSIRESLHGFAQKRPRGCSDS